MATIDIKDVRPGMTGYGLTVFAGTEPERFDVQVIGILHKFRPGMDVILIRSEDPKLALSGATQGMSGSPIYLDGKLAGAFAYGFPFSKTLIAGVTPIDQMLAEMRRPRRGYDPKTGMAADGPTSPVGRVAQRPPASDVHQTALGDGNGTPLAPLASLEQPFWKRLLPLSLLSSVSSVSVAPLASGDGGGGNVEPGARDIGPGVPGGVADVALRPQLVRLAVPVSMAGFSPQSVALLKEGLAPFGLSAYEGTGGGQPPAPRPKTAFKPGSSVGVQLVRGDLSMVGTGTVTHVDADGQNLIAFGHPMFGVGELYLPITTAVVHTFLPSLSVSFKLSSPLDEAGSLIQDRDSCIVANTKLRTPMIPMQVTIRTEDAGKAKEKDTPRRFKAEVARHKMLTPMLAGAVLMSALHTAVSDVTHAVAHVRTRIDIRGQSPLELDDDFYAPDGAAGRSLPAAQGLRALIDLLFNPFDKVAIDGLSVDVALTFRPDYVEIVGLKMEATELEPGRRTNLYVTLRPLFGAERVEVIPIEVPMQLANQTVRIEAASGQVVRPDLAPPENVSQLIANLKKSYSGRSIVISLQTPAEGAFISGHVLSDLPSSELDTLRPSASTRRGEPYRSMARQTHSVAHVVSGKQELTVHVRPRVE